MTTIHPWENHIFIDTEFTDINRPDLISLALVSEDGREFYGEVLNFDRSLCTTFVQENVLPLLGANCTLIFNEAGLRAAVEDWMSGFQKSKQRPVICYDHPVDVQLLWSLLGARAVGWKQRLISSRIDPIRREDYFRKNGGRHHALHDARANAAAFR